MYKLNHALGRSLRNRIQTFILKKKARRNDLFIILKIDQTYSIETNILKNINNNNNFNQVKTLIVGDDIAFMKDCNDIEKRKEARGLSGTVLVYKILGAAAYLGKDLDYIHNLG